MPVFKFTSIEAVPDETWHEPGSAALDAAIRTVWMFSEQTCPRQFPRGVHKYADIDALWAAEEAWDQANFEALWRARGGLPT